MILFFNPVLVIVQIFIGKPLGFGMQRNVGESSIYLLFHELEFIRMYFLYIDSSVVDVLEDLFQPVTEFLNIDYRKIWFIRYYLILVLNHFD